MAATGLQLNTVSASFTPVSGSAVNFTKVTSFSVDPGGQLIEFAGDDDRYPTVIALAMSNPSASMAGGNISQFSSIPIGTDGSLTATMQDAKKATGGNIVWTIDHAVYQNYTASTTHAQFGTGSGSWRCYSPDGQTSPFSIGTS